MMSKNNPMTILSHFYNEEYLLPFWLEHHRKIFDHGILVDYDSTDNSLDIIKEYAPDWTVIKSRNKEFLAWQTDAEIQELESDINGYKFCLQLTEFLLLEEYKNLNEIFTDNIYQIQKCRIHDKDGSADPNTLKELLNEIKYGYFPDDYRFMHKLNSNYTYGMGRHHLISNQSQSRTDKAIVLHFEYYPWNKRFIDRKLQMKNKFPVGYNGPGSHHMRDFSQTNNDRILINQRCEDLSKNNYFQNFIRAAI